MPVMGKLQRVARVQTLKVEPPWVNMASNSAPKSKKQTPEWTPNIYKIKNDGRLNSEKENLPVENLQHNWHKPEEALQMEFAAVAQKLSQ